MLCLACEELVTGLMRHDFTRWIYADHGRNYSYSRKHIAYKVIKRSANQGCEFCRYFEPSFETGGYPPLDITSAYSTVDLTFTTGDDGLAQPPKYFVYDEVANSYSCYSARSFEIFQFHDALSRTALIALPYEVSPQPDSVECVRQAANWLTDCQQLHSKCGPSKLSYLPTRIVDVGSQDGKSDPKLFVPTEGTMGQYLTLSYCWGREGQVCTTQRNIRDHLQRIEMKSLPETLKNAIYMTRLLGFRYIWIDAICIVQDDPDDWNREAARMCSVYENAVLALAALDAPSSNAGFLHARNVDYTALKSSSCTLGIRDPTPRPMHGLAGAALETRGWTLQERVLAPRILHFASDQIYWECSTGLASEAYPAVIEPGRGESDSYYGRSVHDMKTQLHAQVWNGDIIQLWHDLVKEYTGRALTNPSDRHLAIQGLATKFDSYADGDYLFGVWSKAIHVGLLWSVDQTSPHRIVRNAQLPSWSWMSLACPVAFSHAILDDKTVPAAKIEPASSINLPSTLLSLPQTVCLHIEGRIQQGYCILRSSAFHIADFITLSSHSMLDSLYCTLDVLDSSLAEREVITTTIDDGQTVLKEYYCLLIAARKYEHSTTNSFLILESEEDGNKFSRSSRVFRRAGVARQEVFDQHESGILAEAETRLLVLM